jgi:hypothetical protein
MLVEGTRAGVSAPRPGRKPNPRTPITMLEPKPKRITNAQIERAVLVALRDARERVVVGHGTPHDLLLNEAVVRLLGHETLTGDMLDLVVGEGFQRLREKRLVDIQVAVGWSLTEAGEKRANRS